MTPEASTRLLHVLRTHAVKCRWCFLPFRSFIAQIVYCRRLYWFDRGYDPVRLYSASLNGSNVSQVHLRLNLTTAATSLTVNAQMQWLFWTNGTNVFMYDVNNDHVRIAAVARCVPELSSSFSIL